MTLIDYLAAATVVLILVIIILTWNDPGAV